MREESDEADRARNNTESLDSVFGQLNLSSIAVGAGIAGVVSAFSSLAGSIKGFASESINAYSHFEVLQNGLTGLMKNMHEGADAGNELFESLRKFSNETTFGVDTLAGAAQLMLTTGVSADQLNRKLMQIGNLAGGSTEKFNRIVEIYTKSLAMGKAGADQIQSLSAITGTSFVQALGKSSASAEELNSLFEKLTENGGMFEGAMNGLNDTIEGKQGFVTDTFTELLAAFGQASGIAEIYKSILDKVFDVLAGIVSWLQKIGDNPVSKALFQGLIVSALVGVVGVIVGALIPALITTIGKLTIIASLKAAINPMGAILGLVAGAVVGGITALVSYSNAQDKEREKIEKANEELKKQIALRTELQTFSNDTAGAEKTKNNLKDQKTFYKTKLEELKKEKQLKLSNNSLIKDFGGFDADEQQRLITQYGTYEKAFQKFKELRTAEIEESYKWKFDALTTEIENLQSQISFEEKFISSQEEKENVIKSINEMFDNSLSNEEKSLKTLYEGYAKLDALRTKTFQVKTSQNADGTWKVEDKLLVDIDSSFNSKIASAGEDFKKKIKEAEFNLALKNGNWKAIFQQITGVKTFDKGLSGVQAGSEFKKETYKDIEKQISLLKKLYEGSELTDKINNLYNSKANDIESTISKLLNSDERANFGIDDKSISAMLKLVKELRNGNSFSNLFEQTLAALKQEYEWLRKGNEEYEKQQKMKEGFTENQATILLKQEKIKGKAQDIASTKESLGSATGFEKFTKSLEIATEEYKLANLNYELANEIYSQTEKAYEKTVKEYEEALKNGNSELASKLEEKLNNNASQMGSAFTQVVKTQGEQYEAMQNLAKEPIQNSMMNFVNSLDGGSSELRTFADTVTKTGDVLTGVIAAALQGFLNALKKSDFADTLEQILNPFETIFSGLTHLFEMLNNMLSPITTILQSITDILNSLIGMLQVFITPIRLALETIRVPLYMVAKLFNALEKALKPFYNLLERFFGWFDKFSDVEKTTADLEKEQEERLKALNQEYKNLLSAMKEQEEYYLNKKQEINSEKYGASIGSVTSVNDMILTPHGNFSTAPDDYIIATKNPSNLGKSESSNLKLNVKIENTVSNIAEVETRTETDEEGNEQLVVSIIQRVANAIATGIEGMDSALDYRESRLGGRYVTV